VKIKDKILIKDNFFSKEMHNKIKYDISYLNFSNRDTTVNEDSKSIYQKIYFNVPLDERHFAVQEVIKSMNDLMLNYKFYESNYFLSTKHTEPTPHNDTNDLNCLIYLKGAHLINSGTGFYNKVGNEFILNTHVGFKENRAIIFDSKIYHASLQFNEGAGSRYIMANFLNEEMKDIK